MKKIKKIVIVGGGLAGWLTAAVIAAQHKSRIPEEFTITLVETPNLPIVGVGEGTWPTLRTTLSRIGVSESDLFRRCDASFKQGAMFCKWATGQEDDKYFHPLMPPQGFSNINMVPHWLKHSYGLNFCDFVTPQATLASAGLAPKAMVTPEYRAITNYAYHLDAHKFSEFLREHCCQTLGVRHFLADVTRVNKSQDGDIHSLSTDKAGEILGDFFVDCSGSRSILLGEALGVGFKSCEDILFCNRAITAQVPYESMRSPIACHTISTAQSAGWIWDIGLPTCRDIGHVFSSKYLSEDEALKEFQAYIGSGADELNARLININPGHREIFWKNNCVAVGMSAGFLEPLESSAIVLVELSAKLIAEQMPANREIMDIVATRFNETTRYHWGRIIDFLKLHYVLSKRRDTAFWRDNTSPETIPGRLSELLKLWKYHSPWVHDEFDRIDEVFPSASYQYVLYGMQFQTEIEPTSLKSSENIAKKYFQENQSYLEKLRVSLPYHRELIDSINRHGLQRIQRHV